MFTVKIKTEIGVEVIEADMVQIVDGVLWLDNRSFEITDRFCMTINAN